MSSTPSRASSVPVKRSRIETSPPTDCSDRLRILRGEENLPSYIKLLVDVLVDTKKELAELASQCRAAVAENRALREENVSLRAQLESLRSARSNLDSVLSPSQAETSRFPAADSATTIDPDLARSIVVSGVPESPSESSTGRIQHDVACVTTVLNFLNVECMPSAVYRMGPRQSSRPRLLKVILPASRFQREVIQRAPRLRFFFHKGVYIRPSLTKEERDRRREERRASLARSQASASASLAQDCNVSVSVQNNVHHSNSAGNF